MDLNKKRENVAKAQLYLNAANSYLNRAETVAASTVPTGGTWTVDPAVQDIEDRINAEDKTMDRQRLENAAAECFGRAKAQIDEILAPPPANG